VDRDRFDPERFVDPLPGGHRYAWIPFGAGAHELAGTSRRGGTACNLAGPTSQDVGAPAREPPAQEDDVKRILVAMFAAVAGFAAWRRWTDRKHEAELWAEATDPV